MWLLWLLFFWIPLFVGIVKVLFWQLPKLFLYDVPKFFLVTLPKMSVEGVGMFARSGVIGSLARGFAWVCMGIAEVVMFIVKRSGIDWLLLRIKYRTTVWAESKQDRDTLELPWWRLTVGELRKRRAKSV